MESEMQEECGIVGLVSIDPKVDVSKLTYFGLFALQHRGQVSYILLEIYITYFKEAAGFCSKFGHTEKTLGTLGQFTDTQISRLQGDRVSGHVRYSTKGKSNLTNAQPFVTQTTLGMLAVSHNGTLPSATRYTYLFNQLTSRQRHKLPSTTVFKSETDSEIILHMLSQPCPEDSWISRIKKFMLECSGAYSLVIHTDDEIYGVRDPFGFRPLVVGCLGGVYILASETCALTTLGATIIRDVAPGEIVRLDGNGPTWFPGPTRTSSFCSFEKIYFSRPDSYLDKELVHKTRQELGKRLAIEHPAPTGADLVIGVPDSSIPASVGFSKQSGLPYGEGLLKNRQIGRTFIQPTDLLRISSIR